MTTLPIASRRRAGVTLVELLVVCAIIAVLATMAFPAITGAVARSRLTLCMNNLNNLAYGSLRYEEQFGYFPGWRNELPTGEGAMNVSWTIPVLPFIGRRDVYDAIVNDGLTENQVDINTFFCPSSPTSRTGTCVLHYAGNVGTNGINENDGVFLNATPPSSARNYLEYIADNDGSATTLLLAEKSGVGLRPHKWTTVLVSTDVFVSGSAYPVNLETAAPNFGIRAGSAVLENMPVLNPGDYRMIFLPSSLHAGGVPVAFCDGHTMILNEKIPYYVYAQLLTPKTRWINNQNDFNDTNMLPWLRRPASAGSKPYTLDAKDLRQN